MTGRKATVVALLLTAAFMLMMLSGSSVLGGWIDGFRVH